MTRDNEPTCWHRIEATIDRIRQQIRERDAELRRLNAELDSLLKVAAEQREALEKKASKASSGTFDSALNVATDVLTKHARDFQKSGSAYRLIPVAAARDLGIMPIASGWGDGR